MGKLQEQFGFYANCRLCADARRPYRFPTNDPNADMIPLNIANPDQKLGMLVAVCGPCMQAIRAKQQAGAFATARKAMLPSEGPSKVATMLRLGSDVSEAPEQVYATFDSVEAFLQSLDAPTARELKKLSPQERIDYGLTTDLWNNQQRDQIKNNGNVKLGPTWEGFEVKQSWADLLQFWRGGWDEGVARMRGALDSIDIPETYDIRKRATYSDQGTDLDTARLYSGQWDTCWRSSHRTTVATPSRVRIVVEIGSSCGQCNQVAHDAEIVQAETLFWRGAAAVTLGETLEAAGFLVEIVVTAGISKHKMIQQNPYMIQYGLAAAVRVKSFDEPFDISTLTAVTANPAFFRRAFRMWFATVNPDRIETKHGNLIRIENEPYAREQLGLDEPEIATVYVSDWVLAPELANIWTKRTHSGLESVNNPDFVPDEADEALLEESDQTEATL